MKAPYIPDVGDTFEVTDRFGDEHSYRVSSWLRRRPPRPDPDTEEGWLLRQIFDEMIADGRIEGPRGAGPDDVPLEWCRREDAEYVCGSGVAGIIVRVSDVTVTGRVSWAQERIDYYRRQAEMLAGEPLA